MSFLFVDRILQEEPGKFIKGIKFVTAQDTYLMASAAGLIFYPALIGETLGQLAAWTIIHASDYQYRPIAGVANDIRIFGNAKPGDVLELECIIHRWDTQAIEYEGIARVAGQTVFSIGSAIGPMVLLTDFSDPERVRSEYQRINRPGEFTLLPLSDETAILGSAVQTSVYAQYDHILEWEPGVHAKAVKLVSLTAPYFPDHFARKPVLPLTLLLQSQSNLAAALLNAGQSENWNLSRYSKVKMNEFVQPGDALVTDFQVKSRDEDETLIQMISSVNEERVCVSQAVFRKEAP